MPWNVRQMGGNLGAPGASRPYGPGGSTNGRSSAVRRPGSEYMWTPPSVQHCVVRIGGSRELPISVTARTGLNNKRCILDCRLRLPNARPPSQPHLIRHVSPQQGVHVLNETQGGTIGAQAPMHWLGAGHYASIQSWQATAVRQCWLQADASRASFPTLALSTPKLDPTMCCSSAGRSGGGRGSALTATRGPWSARNCGGTGGITSHLWWNGCNEATNNNGCFSEPEAAIFCSATQAALQLGVEPSCYRAQGQPCKHTLPAHLQQAALVGQPGLGARRNSHQRHRAVWEAPQAEHVGPPLNEAPQRICTRGAGWKEKRDLS